MSSSPSPSSSAVTIPTPGKSILKRPPPPQQSFFSLARLSKLLPTQNQSTAASDDAQALKRAHFILPEMTIVYPILASNPPSSAALREEKRVIEEKEAERRRRVLHGSPLTAETKSDDWWSLDKVESFYRECCVGREETPDPGISAAFKHATSTHPRTVELSGVQLTVGSASVLSDVFTIEWGLRKLVLKECDLDEHILKPILHSLLIPGTLTFLSVASNRRIKAPAFRVIGAYVTKAKGLQFLDLSQNSLDKKSIEYVAAALPATPELGLASLKLDDCLLKPAALDALAHIVRTSSLRNISLRHNRINATGAVAIALMIKDYPDRLPSTPTSPSTISPNSSATFLPLSPPPPISATSTTSPISSGIPTPPPRLGPVLPPPRHPAAGPQTTYTPYIPRSRRTAATANTNTQPPPGSQVSIITSSQGGVTARHSMTPTSPPSIQGSAQGQQQHDHGPSVALLDKVRALDALPRLGFLRTLDLRGNDIRTGITYIAQVLKRNRTLKVLNLSENKLDVQGLVAIAEALKYNSCLETLDLSKNPCCGPGLEGIQSLRTAFTLNDALKRLFLSSTSMTSAGAIALAEFLPESTSLLHLDLTTNNLDLAGVMALSSGLKANHIMRCLDLNIPPGDEEMARMCRNILNSCTRNTEEAEKRSNSSPTGQAKNVWGMLEDSELAKSIRQDDRKRVDEPTADSPVQVNGRPNESAVEQSKPDIIAQARSCKTALEDIVSRSPSSSSAPVSPIQDLDPDLTQQTREVQKALAATILNTVEPARLEELLSLNDELTSLLHRCLPPNTRPTLHGLGIVINNEGLINSGKKIESSNSSAMHETLACDDSADEEPVTPRIDKGKGRAEPEPEELEKVLSPTFLIDSAESDEENVEAPDEVESVVSPTDRSRSWVAEEGEVFRKGTVLLGPEEMEGEYDGEELRKELLEAMVERPPPRSMVDGFDDEPQLAFHEGLSSPTTQEPKKPPPRPYIRRTRSSSVDPQKNESSDSLSLDAHSPPASILESPNLPSLANRSTR